VFCHNSSSACCAFVYDRSEPLTAVYCRWLSFCLSSQNGSRSVPGSRSGSGRFLSLAGVPGFGRIILFTFCSMWIETAAAGSDTGCGFFCARHLPVTASDLAQAVPPLRCLRLVSCRPGHVLRSRELLPATLKTRQNAACRLFWGSVQVALPAPQFCVSRNRCTASRDVTTLPPILYVSRRVPSLRVQFQTVATCGFVGTSSAASRNVQTVSCKMPGVLRRRAACCFLGISFSQVRPCDDACLLRCVRLTPVADFDARNKDHLHQKVATFSVLSREKVRVAVECNAGTTKASLQPVGVSVVACLHAARVCPHALFSSRSDSPMNNQQPAIVGCAKL